MDISSPEHVFALDLTIIFKNSPCNHQQVLERKLGATQLPPLGVRREPSR